MKRKNQKKGQNKEKEDILPLLKVKIGINIKTAIDLVTNKNKVNLLLNQS